MFAPTSVYQSFYPFSYVSITFAVLKIREVAVGQSGQSYQTNPWSKFIFVANAFALISSTVTWHLVHKLYLINESAVFFWSMAVFNWATLLRFISIHIMRLVNHRKEMQLYAAMDDFDKKIVALGKSKEIAAANKKVVKYGIIAIPASILVHILSEIFTNAVGYVEVAVAITFARFLISYVGILAKIQFYLWSTVMTERFGMINDLMLKVKERFQLNNMFVVSVYKYEQCIEKYGDLHRELTHLVRQMNDMYQFDLLWHFFIMFVMIFTSGFYSAYKMLQSAEDYSQMSMVSNFFFVLFEIMLSIKSSTDLCNESYKALEIFNNLKVDPDDTSTQRLVISSIFELKENRLEITACRFFNVNYSTLAVMFTIITNYVFILLQFEETVDIPKNSTLSSMMDMNATAIAII